MRAETLRSSSSQKIIVADNFLLGGDVSFSMLDHLFDKAINPIKSLSFSKAGAKVLLFFELTKYFAKKIQKKHYFSYFFSISTPPTPR